MFLQLRQVDRQSIYNASSVFSGNECVLPCEQIHARPRSRNRPSLCSGQKKVAVLHFRFDLHVDW
jgi:hypothetical protein